MWAAGDMRRDSVVAGQIIGQSSLSLLGGPGQQARLSLELEPADDGEDVLMRFDSEATHLLERELPARVRATIPRESSNQLLRALRKMCVAERCQGRRRKGLQVSWQLQLSGGLWEIGFCETEEHPPLGQALDAVTALTELACRTAGAQVLEAPPAPVRRPVGWLALLALLAALALTALAMVVLSGCGDTPATRIDPSGL